MIPPDVIALTPYAADRMAEARRRRFDGRAARPPATTAHSPSNGGTSMLHTSSVSVRLRGFTAAARVARIPVICALVVALASDAAISRAIAVVVAIAAVMLGVALHAREIFLGRFASGEREPVGTRLISSEDWAARERVAAR